MIWTRLNPKMKNLTINNNYKNDALKSVSIAAKISSLKSFWIKRIFNGNFHDWKIRPLHIIYELLGEISYFILTYK